MLKLMERNLLLVKEKNLFMLEPDCKSIFVSVFEMFQDFLVFFIFFLKKSNQIKRDTFIPGEKVKIQLFVDNASRKVVTHVDIDVIRVKSKKKPKFILFFFAQTTINKTTDSVGATAKHATNKC